MTRAGYWWKTRPSTCPGLWPATQMRFWPPEGSGAETSVRQRGRSCGSRVACEAWIKRSGWPRFTREARRYRRNSELAKIHIGKKQLFDDDGDYRAMLKSVVGVRSAADLDQAGLKRNPSKRPEETALKIRKIRAMLAEEGLPDA